MLIYLIIFISYLRINWPHSCNMWATARRWPLIRSEWWDCPVVQLQPRSTAVTSQSTVMVKQRYRHLLKHSGAHQKY